MAQTRRLTQLALVGIVFLGGFAGSSLRYAVESVVPSSLVATATVNVVGCIALGVVLYEQLYAGALSKQTQTFAATGFIASFTTYSTFVVDAVTATPLVAPVYVVGSYALGFAGVLVGRTVARKLTPDHDWEVRTR